MRRYQSLSIVLLIGLIIGGLPQLAFGQDSPKNLEDLYQDWRDLNGKLDDVESKIKSDPVDATLKDEQRDLLSQIDRLIDTLESAARGKLDSDRTSKLAIQLLMGISLEAASKNNDSKALEIGDFLITKGLNRKYLEIASKSDRLSLEQRQIFDELQIRHDEAMANDLPRVKLKTTKGDIVIELFENEAPGTVGNFISLCQSGFYKDRLFHRVIEGFIAQSGGYRNGKKEDSPGYEIKSEFSNPDKRLHFAGSLSMANRMAPDTGSSQFFISFERVSKLDGKHTVFGRIVDGQKTLENLERTHTIGPDGKDRPIDSVFKDKIIDVEILRKRDHEYTPVKAEKKQESQDEEPAGDSNLQLNAPDGEDGG